FLLLSRDPMPFLIYRSSQFALFPAALEHRLPSLCAKQACSLFSLSRLKPRSVQRRRCLFSPMQPLKVAALILLSGVVPGAANAQIQVQLKFSRLQYIAYEPLLATVTITNRAGRDIDLNNDAGERWFGFEITGSDGQSIPADSSQKMEPLRIEAGQTVTQKINLATLYPLQDFGTYHVRAHVYFSDLGRYFYSPTKVVEVTDARPIWKQSVGIPVGSEAGGDARTYSLLTNRFADHTSLYVRVEDEHRSVVYATYSLGHVIAFDDPYA